MAVLDPIKVTITNFPGSPTEVQVPNFPADESKGHHTIPLDNTLYIERDDFREVRAQLIRAPERASDNLKHMISSSSYKGKEKIRCGEIDYNLNAKSTRMHSSRMRTARSLTVSHCIRKN